MPLATDTDFRSFADQALHYFLRDHVRIPDGPVQSNACWSGAELRDDIASWRVELTPAQIDEISEITDALMASGLPQARVTRDKFSLPALSEHAREWAREIRSGRGFVVVRGLPVRDWGYEKTAYAYWGLGHHLGIPGAQNATEELLGHVRDYGDSGSELVRQYRTTENIEFHCDAADAVGLLCLQPARQGGQSRIVSSVSVFNELWSRRPDLASRLFEPYPLDRRNENAEGEPGFVPIQPCCYGNDGVLRTFYHGHYFRSAQRFPEAAIDDAGLAALELYDELCEDPDRHLDMWLEPGDMQFISNHTIVHARTGFEDWPEPERRRHLLRLWLSLE